MSVHFKEQVSALRTNLELVETEETWDYICDSIQSLTELCRDGACEYPDQVVPVIRSLSRPLSSAMKSERTRLSGMAMDLISALAEGLGLSFEPLLALFFPTLLTLCGRPNKVVISRARACIVSIIDNTQLPTVLPFLLQHIKDKSTTLRLAAAESALIAVNALDPLDLEKEPRVQDIEALIKATARDANADIRKVSRGIFSSYQLLFPNRVDRFTDPLTPTMKKYLNIKKQAPVPALPPLKQPPKKLDPVSNSTSDRPAPPAKPPTKSNHQPTQSVDRQVPTTDPNPPVKSRRTKATHTSSSSRERNNAMPPPPPPPPKPSKAVTEPAPSQPKSSKSVAEPAPSRSKSSKPVAAPPAPAPVPVHTTNLSIPKSNAPGRVPAKPTQPSSGAMQLHMRQRTVSGPGPMRTLILSNLAGSSHPNSNGNTNAESTPPFVVQTQSGPQRIHQGQRTESTERKTEQERKAELLKEIQAQLGLGRSDSDSGKPGRVRVGDSKTGKVEKVQVSSRPKVEKVPTKEKIKLAAQVAVPVPAEEKEKEKVRDKPVWGGGRTQPQPQPQSKALAPAPAPAPTHVRSKSAQGRPIVVGKTRTTADAERERPSSKASTRSHSERERPSSKASVRAERERPSSKASVRSQTATTQKEVEKNKKEEPLVDVAVANDRVPDPTTIPLPRTPSPSPQPIPIPQTISKTPITTLLLSIERGFDMSFSSSESDSPMARGLLGKSQNQIERFRLKTPFPLHPRRSSSLGDLRGFVEKQKNENAVVFGVDEKVKGRAMPTGKVPVVSIFARPKERNVFDDVFNVESF